MSHELILGQYSATDCPAFAPKEAEADLAAACWAKIREMPIQRRRILLAFSCAALVACGRNAEDGSDPSWRIRAGAGRLDTFGLARLPRPAIPRTGDAHGWRVVNAGVPGDTSEGALARLPALLRQHSPELVLVSIGGNDFLRRLSPAETRANIRSICQLASAAGAQVLLVGVPEASVLASLSRSLSDHRMYEELSTEMKLPLHAGGGPRCWAIRHCVPTRFMQRARLRRVLGAAWRRRRATWACGRRDSASVRESDEISPWEAAFLRPMLSRARAVCL